MKTTLKPAALCMVCALFFIVAGCKNSNPIFEDNEDTQLQEVSTRSGESVWDYPVKPGMEEWKRFKSKKEMVDACQIPEKIMSSLSTEDLTDICLRYPGLINIYFYDNWNEGLDVQFDDFNGFRELYRREGATSVLMKRYREKLQNISSLNSMKTSLEQGRFVISVSTLELILSRFCTQHDDAKNYSEVLKSLVAGYEDKFACTELFKGLGFRTNLFARAHIISGTSPQSMDKISEEHKNYLLSKGIIFDMETLDLINELSNQLIN